MFVGHGNLWNHLETGNETSNLSRSVSFYCTIRADAFKCCLTLDGWRPVYIAVYGMFLAFMLLDTFPIISSVKRSRNET